jgi:DNA polymerase-3 subunit alpha (Gram-positive type)
MADTIRQDVPDSIASKFDTIIKKLKEYSSIKSAEIERISLGCVGVKRTTGQHPAGIGVVPDYMDVADFTPFQFPADDPTSAWRTTHFSYHAIDQDLLKLDILGHSDPTQLRQIQDQSKTDILKVPLDDKDTMSIFTTTKALGVTNEQILCPTGTLGIPEFGTPFTIGMVEDTKPKTFAELVKISGLSHGTDVWLGNAQELIKKNIVPFKETIGCRDDIMVYLMYNGVKPIKAFKIMEFVRKGKASKEPEAWMEHVKTMEEANIPDWYIKSCQKIKYMFPKAHATAYVMSAFRIAWYKVHMPVYFYSSWLTTKATDVDVDSMIEGYDSIKKRLEDIEVKGYEATNKEAGQAESLKVALEATARGIKFLPIDLYKSDATVWTVNSDNEIYPPFSSIEGLGDTVAKNIVEEREKGKFISIEDVQKRAKVSQTLIDKMKDMEILKDLPDSNQLSLF